MKHLIVGMLLLAASPALAQTTTDQNAADGPRITVRTTSGELAPKITKTQGGKTLIDKSPGPVVIDMRGLNPNNPQGTGAPATGQNELPAPSNSIACPNPDPVTGKCPEAAANPAQQNQQAAPAPAAPRMRIDRASQMRSDKSLFKNPAEQKNTAQPPGMPAVITQQPAPGQPSTSQPSQPYTQQNMPYNRN